MKKSLPIAATGSFLASKLWVRKLINKERLPARGKVIVASNHSSLLDGIVLSAYIKWLRKGSSHTIAYKEPFDHWFFGWILRSGRCIPFDRKDPASIEQMLRRALGYLEMGLMVTIFPEGHLNNGKSLRLPRPGMSLLALESGAPILPVGLRGTADAWPAGGKISPKGNVSIHFGKLICTQAMSEEYHKSASERRKELLTELTQKTMEDISELSAMPLHRRMRRQK